MKRDDAPNRNRQSRVARTHRGAFGRQRNAARRHALKRIVERRRRIGSRFWFHESKLRRAQKAQKIQRQHCFQLYLHDRADEVLASFSSTSLKQSQRLKSRLEGVVRRGCPLGRSACADYFQVHCFTRIASSRRSSPRRRTSWLQPSSRDFSRWRAKIHFRRFKRNTFDNC